MALKIGNDGTRSLLPMASVTGSPTIPGGRFAKFQASFDADPVNAVFKATVVQWVKGAE